MHFFLFHIPSLNSQHRHNYWRITQTRANNKDDTVDNKCGTDNLLLSYSKLAISCLKSTVKDDCNYNMINQIGRLQLRMLWLWSYKRTKEWLYYTAAIILHIVMPLYYCRVWKHAMQKKQIWVEAKAIIMLSGFNAKNDTRDTDGRNCSVNGYRYGNYNARIYKMSRYSL